MLDRLLNKIIDVMHARWPGYRKRKIDSEIAMLERQIDKEMMLSDPKQNRIDEIERNIIEKKRERAKL